MHRSVSLLGVIWFFLFKPATAAVSLPLPPHEVLSVHSLFMVFWSFVVIDFGMSVHCVGPILSLRRLKALNSEDFSCVISLVQLFLFDFIKWHADLLFFNFLFLIFLILGRCFNLHFVFWLLPVASIFFLLHRWIYFTSLSTFIL